ncbi:MAG TPA: hypothetical protein DDY31_13830 [Lachnospiraceae bacterium]|nr:hypothetical protein [Lachnospiraceae bacterium]
MLKKWSLQKIAGIFLLLFVFAVIGKPEPAEAATAEKIELNQDYAVQLEDSYDSLLYEFTVPEAGNISVQMKDTNPAGGYEMQLQLFDANNLMLASKMGYSANVELPVYSTDGNRIFYLKLIGGYDAYKTSYVFTVNFAPNTDWESEDNNTTASADVISAGKDWYGAINDLNDPCDYFKFRLGNSKKVTIKFGPKEVSGNSDSWDVELIDSSNQSQKISDGSSTIQTYTCYLKKGTYYLKITGRYNSKNVPYAISYREFSLDLSAPRISSMKLVAYTDWIPFVDTPCVGISNVKIKYSGDATGYMLKVAKKKSMKGKLTEGRIDFDDKNTKKQVELPTYLPVVKTYYVQARSYVTDPFGVRMYGNYGAVKSVSLSDSLYRKLKG